MSRYRANAQLLSAGLNLIDLCRHRTFNFNTAALDEFERLSELNCVNSTQKQATHFVSGEVDHELIFLLTYGDSKFRWEENPRLS
jgi:hypothetical protein